MVVQMYAIMSDGRKEYERVGPNIGESDRQTDRQTNQTLSTGQSHDNGAQAQSKQGPKCTVVEDPIVDVVTTCGPSG